MMVHPQHPQIKLLSYVNIISLSKSNNPPKDLSKKKYFSKTFFYEYSDCTSAFVQSCNCDRLIAFEVVFSFSIILPL